MEVNEDDHLFPGRLEEGVFDVVVEDVDFVSLYGRVAKAIGVCFQNTLVKGVEELPKQVIRLTPKP